jgi:hypothetical protein
MRRRPPELEQVELVGIPHYAQGEADSLCVYYAMSMMLAALYPAWGPTMHDTPRYSWKGSPVFQALRRLYRSERQFKAKISDWFFKGMTPTEATSILNRLFRDYFGSNDTYFDCRRVRTRRVRRLRYARHKRAIERTWTAQDVLAAISWHLPVLITGGGLESHAALATGYSVEGRTRWLCYLDPATVRPEWWHVGDIFTDGATAIVPRDEQFREHRPSRIITNRGVPRFEPWTSGRAAT